MVANKLKTGKDDETTDEEAKQSHNRLFRDGSTGRRGFLTVVGTAAAAGVFSTGTVGQSDGSLENEEIEVTLSASSSVGSFTLRAAELDDGHLLYPSPSTTYLTVQVDGTNYTTTGSGEQMDQYLTDEPAFDGDSVDMVWELPESVVVTQTIELVGPLAEFTVEVENTSGQSRNVNVRYLFDYQVEQQDGSPVWLQNEVITTETEFENIDFDSWKTYNQIPDPTLTGLAEIETEPQLIQFVSWPRAVGAPYDYEIDPDYQFFNPESETGDSAGLLYWELGSIGEGDTESIVTRYGLGEPGDSTETFNLRFEDQESDGDAVVVQSVYLPRPGFIAIHNEDDDVVGVSEYLTIGSHGGIEIDLDPTLQADATLIAMLHEDTNDNEEFDFVETNGEDDGPFTDEAGDAVIDDALITLPEEEGDEVDDEPEDEPEDDDEPEDEPEDDEVAPSLDLSVSAPDSVSHGETACFDVTVQNHGDDAVEVMVTLEVGDVTESSTFEIEAGDCYANVHTVAGSDLSIGDAEWTVTAGEEHENGTLTVTNE